MPALSSRFRAALAKALRSKDEGAWGKRIGLISTVGTAVTAVFAGLKYVFGFFTPIGLEIALPPLIEFRCSSTDFDGKACIRGQPDRYYMTVSAALYLRATGDASKEATITSAEATIKDRNTGGKVTLTWLWSANLVPNQDKRKELEGARTQVTAYSLKGGDTRGLEMWFFPLDQACGEKSVSQCNESRANFVQWMAFLRGIMAADVNKPATQSGYEISFRFDYREGDKPGHKTITCEIESSETLRRMADPVANADRGVLYISAPCREVAGRNPK